MCERMDTQPGLCGGAGGEAQGTQETTLNLPEGQEGPPQPLWAPLLG